MKRLGILTVLLTLALAGAGPAAADEAAWLFEPDHVTEIDLDLPGASRDALAVDPDEYVQATFSLTRADGTEYGPLLVGVKLKGTGSFRALDRKAAFKLKFNEFVKGQKFLGLKKMTLNNMVQDATMLHEMLAYEAFRAVGLPSWRTGYSFLQINGESFGLYLNIETPDDVSLPRSHPTTQHLYEGDKGVDLVPGGAPQYEIDQGGGDLADLEALIAGVADWDGIDAVADLEQMTRFWAVERYIGHWDGYTGATPNNYYLHSDAAGRFTMLPWGTDQTWHLRPAYDEPGGLHVQPLPRGPGVPGALPRRRRRRARDAGRTRPRRPRNGDGSAAVSVAGPGPPSREHARGDGQAPGRAARFPRAAPVRRDLAQPGAGRAAATRNG